MVTVSIVTYNTEIEELATCLQSLSSDKISRIYIIDNSSQSYIEQFCADNKKVTYIPSKNIGYGSANNIAMRYAMEENIRYHLVLNTDVYFDPTIIDKIVNFLDQNEDVAQLIPNVIYPNGTLQYVCRTLPSPLDLLFRRFFPHTKDKKRDIRHCLMFFDHKKTINVPNHQGSFMFFRTNALAKVGLFDERYFMYAEDIDLTRRVHKYYKTIFWPEVTIVHAHRAASYKSLKMFLIHAKSVLKYFNKWGWFFDKERKEWNKELLQDLGYKSK